MKRLFVSAILLVIGHVMYARPVDSVLLNVVYATNTTFDGKEQKLTLDLYFPRSARQKPSPLILLMHGGGFVSGSKDAMKGYCNQLADSGFVAASINYRKGWNTASAIGGCATLDVQSLTNATYRAIQDAYAALTFLSTHAKRYGIDTSWLFIGGSSAGAVTALNLAYLNGNYVKAHFAESSKTLGPIRGQTSELKPDFRIRGICNLWGALPDTALVDRASALPIISFHGTADTTIPYEAGRYKPCPSLPLLYGSAPIHRQTVRSGQISVLNVSHGGKHGPVEFTRAVIASNVACFFHRVMTEKAQTAVYEQPKPGCR
jgi:poly(3-hydroxybutyrate) depolymerase